MTAKTSFKLIKRAKEENTDTKATTDKQNANSRQLFSVQIHYHNLKKNSLNLLHYLVKDKLFFNSLQL